MSSVEPGDGYLEFLRDTSKKNGALLIFDEVIKFLMVLLEENCMIIQWNSEYQY